MESQFVSRHITNLLKTIVDFKKRKLQELCPLDLQRLNLWIHKLQIYHTIPVDKGHFIDCLAYSLGSVDDDSYMCLCRAILGIENLFHELLERYPEPNPKPIIQRLVNSYI